MPSVKRVDRRTAGRGGLCGYIMLPLVCLLALPWPLSGASARDGLAFAPVILRLPLTETARGAQYWRVVGRGWLRALETLSPRLPLSGASEEDPFSAPFRLALAAAVARLSITSFPSCETPPADPWPPLEQGEPLAMCVSRPGTLTVTVSVPPDARERMTRLLASSDRVAAWRRLLDEVEQAVRVLGAADTAPEKRRMATDALRALLGDARRLLRHGDGGWLADARDMPLLEGLVESVPESALLRLLLAEARLRAGLPQQCMEAASAALRLAPDMTRARYVRALAHWRLQQLALAEEDFDAALRTSPVAVGTAPHDARRRGLLRARGALRMLRGNTGGMCEDLTAACALGDCEGLLAVRGRGQCLPPGDMPVAEPAIAPPRLPALEVEGRRDVPIWPPVTSETARALARVLPVRVKALPDPFVFSVRP